MKKLQQYITIAVTLPVVLFLFHIINTNISEYTNWEASTQKLEDPDCTRILVDINEKMLYAITEGKITARYRVACGKPSTPSPLGDFVIVRKDKWGEGFGTAWLGLDVPWGTYGIHGTTRPQSIGRAASGGCIRMRNEDINKLYKIVRVGTPVKIVGGIYGMMGNGYRILLPGDRGSDVYIIQNKLKELGFYDGRLDGIYGTSMEKALNKFQSSRHIPIANNITERIYKELGIILFE